MEWISTNVIILFVIGWVIGAFIGLIVVAILVLKGYKLIKIDKKIYKRKLMED